MTIPHELVADRYRLVRTIGVGGMGRVWLASDNILHRDVAIKEVIPPRGLTQDERDEMANRTLREARAAARLSHPNVVRVYDVIRTEHAPWIVMEYVPSRSLHQVVNEDGPQPPERVARIGLEVLAALQAAHRAGVVHRDVKPANVLLAEDGRVVLGDFGLATFEGGDGTVTRPGLILGSPQYIAPERALNGASLPESDLWSLGATLYAAVEGRSPYARETAIATLTALATEDPDPMVRAGALKPALNGLLRKDPRSRATAADAERLLFRAAGILERRSRSRMLPLQRRSREAPPALPESSPATAPAASAAIDASPNPPPAAPAAHSPVPASPARDLPARSSAGPVAGAAAGVAPAGSVVPSFLRATPGGSVARSDGAPGGKQGDRPPADESLTEVVTRPVAGSTLANRVPAPRSAGTAARERTVSRLRAAVGHGSAGDDGRTWAGTARSELGRRWVAVTAIMVAVAVLVALVLQEVRQSQIDAQARADRAASAAATTDSPDPSAATESPTLVAPGRPAAQPQPGDLQLPSGWNWHADETGFRVAVPQGWEMSRDGTVVYFRDAASGRTLGIGQSNQPVEDPVAAWTAEEQARVAAGDYPAYARVAIQPFTFWKWCADWEFTFDDPQNGSRQHALNRGFTTSDTRAYSIFWLTRDFDWGTNRPLLDLVSASFQPAR